MQITNSTARRLAELLAVRVNQYPAELGGDTHPAAVAELLEDAGLACETADAVAWGTLSTLSALDLERVALAFLLEPNLLGLLLHPAGGDVVAQTLTDVVQQAMDPDCDECDHLRLRAELYVANDGDLDEPLEPILYDLLVHIARRVGPPDDQVLALFPDEPDWDDDADERSDPAELTDEQRPRWRELLGRSDDEPEVQAVDAERVAGLRARLLEAWEQLPPTIQEQFVVEAESAAAPIDVVEQMFGDDVG